MATARQILSHLRNLCEADHREEDPPEARGIVAELEAMATDGELSRPVETLLQGDAADFRSEVSSRPDCVPAVLSHAQQRVLASASHVPLTVILGPPGTGKSLALAALALDHLRRGETVLVASRTHHAVDVVQRKIASLFARCGACPWFVRAGRERAPTDLKDSLEVLLESTGSAAGAGETDLSSLERRLAALREELAEIERELLRRATWERNLGSVEEGDRPHPFASLARWLNHTYLEWRIGGLREAWDLARDYEATLEERDKVTAALLEGTFRKRLREALANDRRSMMGLLDALRAQSGDTQDQILAELDIEVLLRVFPIWFVSFSDVHRKLPLRRELFDVTIVDEATQCDVASALPVFHRARRAAVAARQRLTETYKRPLDCGNRSLIEVAREAPARRTQVVALDAHFRSASRSLRVRASDTDRLKIATPQPGTIRGEGVIVRTVAGGRRPGGSNPGEADAVEAEIRRWVEAEASLGADICHSLGVLSPFHAQVDLLKSRLARALPAPAFDKHDLLVGSVDTFRGEERDVMFISLVVDRASLPGSMRPLDTPDVFDVAVTRSRSHQYVFLSMSLEEVTPGSLLRRYLEDIRLAATHPSETTTGDPWLARVADTLGARGFRVWPHYRITGVEVDLVVEKGGRSVGVDLIGFPGPLARPLDLERYRRFQMRGLRLFPLPRSAWLASEDACIRELESWLEPDESSESDVRSVPEVESQSCELV